jgi:hypothetical protein
MSFKIQYSWDVTPYRLVNNHWWWGTCCLFSSESKNAKIEAENSLRLVIIYQSTWCQIPEDQNVY